MFYLYQRVFGKDLICHFIQLKEKDVTSRDGHFWLTRPFRVETKELMKKTQFFSDCRTLKWKDLSPEWATMYCWRHPTKRADQRRMSFKLTLSRTPRSRQVTVKTCNLTRKLRKTNQYFNFAVIFHFSDFSPAFPPNLDQLKPFLGTVLGIIGAVVLIISAIILVVKLRSSKRTSRQTTNQTNNEMNATISPSLQNGILLQEQCNGSADSIDKNPDIIPQGKLQCIQKTFFSNWITWFS